MLLTTKKFADEAKYTPLFSSPLEGVSSFSAVPLKVQSFLKKTLDYSKEYVFVIKNITKTLLIVIIIKIIFF